MQRINLVLTGASNTLVDGGFSYGTAPFGLHPLDQERAMSYLLALWEEGKTWSDAEVQITNYLQNQNMIPAQITIEVSRAKAILEPWL